jgi:hypothetical protein
MEALPTRVRKRDGREESFDAVRLADSLQAALEAVGQDGARATVLAAAVAGALAGSGTVETADLAEGAESALAVSGHPEAAARYIAHRVARLNRLARVRVHTAQGRDTAARPWDRPRLAMSLVRDRYLESTLAWQVARRVERRLVDSGLRHLTGRLVAALADNECRTMGLRADPLGAEHVGLDRREMRAWLGGDCLPTAAGGLSLTAPGRDPRPALGGELLARFAVEDVLSAPQREGLRTGRFDLPALGDWMRPARLLLRPAEDENEQAFWRRVAEERSRAHEVQVWWPAGRPWSDLARRAPGWLSVPGARLRLRTGDLALARAWAQEGEWVRVPLMRFLDAPRELQAGLAEQGRVLLEWWPAAAAPRVLRARTELRGCAVINLAAAALGPEAGERAFFAAVGESVELACGALRLLAERADGEGRGEIALLPAGLAQALSQLWPGADAGSNLLRRFLLTLRATFARHARAQGLVLRDFAPPHPEGAGARLAALDPVEASFAYPVGWEPLESSPVPPASAFAAAPWLELSAEAALQHPDLRRLAAPGPTS